MPTLSIDSNPGSLPWGSSAQRRGFAPIVSKLVFAMVAAAALPTPAAAQNLLERSTAPPPYEEQESPPPFAPPAQPPAPRATPLPLPGATPAAPGSSSLPTMPGQPAKPGANPAQPGGAAPAATPAAEEPAPPYEPQLLRLSELLGALTYLQDLCGGQKGDIWRDKMTALMDAETQNETRRERLAGAYNRGFTGYELNYRQCTPNAEAIITRFLNESGRIARDVTRRYGTS
jgi:uncharacterized protein (TIGR02301 family)